MGNPVFEPAAKDTDPSVSPNCPAARPARRLERNPFRRRTTFAPGADPPDGAWSVWTRSIRRRFEVLQYDALPADGVERLTAEERTRLQRGDSEAPTQRTGQTEARPRHRYTVRLGYDPRVFLEDPALRGQKLTPEAEAWAAEYRSRIPMMTDLQVSRRQEPEPAAPGQQQQSQSAARSARWPALGEQPVLVESSDEDVGVSDQPEAPLEQLSREQGSAEHARALSLLQRTVFRARAQRATGHPDNPPGRLSLLQQLASADSPFRTATPRARLNMLGEAITAARWELSEAPSAADPVDARERERPASRAASERFQHPLTERTPRGRPGSHEERLRDLLRLVNEGPTTAASRREAQDTDRRREAEEELRYTRNF